QSDVGKPQQRPIMRRRLDSEGVKHSAAELSGLERIVERLIIDQRAARSVDEERARLHPRQRIAIDESCRLWRDPRMQADDVGLLQQLAQRDMLDPVAAVLCAE